MDLFFHLYNNSLIDAIKENDKGETPPKKPNSNLGVFFIKFILLLFYSIDVIIPPRNSKWL